jgi:hypothetical protein
MRRQVANLKKRLRTAELQRESAERKSQTVSKVNIAVQEQIKRYENINAPIGIGLAPVGDRARPELWAFQFTIDLRWMEFEFRNDASSSFVHEPRFLFEIEDKVTREIRNLYHDRILTRFLGARRVTG